MKFSPAFLEELKARAPIVELVGRRVKLRRRGRNHVGLCPFHSEKTPSFNVSDERGSYKCFGCGVSGDAITFVQETENLTFPEAVEKLAAEAGLEVPRSAPRDPAREQARDRLAAAMEAACRRFEDNLAGAGGTPARDYLAGRGLDRETIRAFRLGFAPPGSAGLKTALLADGFEESELVEAGLLIRPEQADRGTYDRFRNRIIFPIRDRRGRVIAFGARLLEGDGPKYLNSPETPLFRKGWTLYNLDRAAPAARGGATIVVAEGYMDVIALVRAGFEGAVAPLGTAITEDQLTALWRLGAEPVLCLDGDDAGRRAALATAERALPLVKPDRSLRFVFLSEGEDPDSLVSAEQSAILKQYIGSARSLFDALWHLEIEGRSIATPERRAALKLYIYKRISLVKDRTIHDLYVQEAAKRFHSLFDDYYKKFDSREKSFVGLKSKLRPEDLRQTMAKGLIAALLNHPDAIEKLEEEIGRTPIENQKLQSLLSKTLTQYKPGITRADLIRTLEERSESETIRTVLSPSNYVIAPFAQPGVRLAVVIHRWLEASKVRRIPVLLEELSIAEARLVDEGSEAARELINLLLEDLQSLKSEEEVDFESVWQA